MESSIYFFPGKLRKMSKGDCLVQAMLMFSLVQVLSFTLNVPSSLISLIVGGRWFQVTTDLTMKAFL